MHRNPCSQSAFIATIQSGEKESEDERNARGEESQKEPKPRT